MQTIFIYDSKYGGTKELVTLMAQQVNHSTFIQAVEEQKTESLSEFNQIVFCAPAYAGHLRKSGKQYLENNHSLLLTKKLFLVNTGIQFEDEKIQTQLAGVFPKQLRDHAELTTFIGTIASIDKMNFFERMILKKVFSDNDLPFDSKTEYRHLKQEAINQLLDKVNAKHS